MRSTILLLLALYTSSAAHRVPPISHTRRAVLTSAVAAAAVVPPQQPAAADVASTLDLKLSATGVKWAELRAAPPTGATPEKGQQITIDYMMTRRAGAKIYSTVDSKVPFSWTLGDGTVIEGLELAVLGGGDLPPLKVGGARRVVVPQALAYGRDRGFFNAEGGAPTEIRRLNPVPPDFVWRDAQGDAVNAYLRFKYIYLDEMALDQPDLILDISLRAAGAPAAAAAAPAPPTIAQAPPPPAPEPPPAPVAASPPPAVPPAMRSAADEQVALQLETLQKELRALEAAEANAAKYGNPGGGFSSSGLESLKNELAALQAAQ